MQGLDWNEYAVKANAAIDLVVLTPPAAKHLQDIKQEADCPEQAKLLLCFEEDRKLYVGSPVGVHTSRFASLHEYESMTPHLEMLTYKYGLHASYLQTDNRIITGNIEPPGLTILAELKQKSPTTSLIHYHTHSRTSEKDLDTLWQIPENRQQLVQIEKDIRAGIYDYLSTELGHNATTAEVISYESCTKPSPADLESAEGTSFAIITQMCASTLTDGVLIFRGSTRDPEYVQRIPVTIGKHNSMSELDEIYDQRMQDNYANMRESFAGAMTLLRAHEFPGAREYLTTPLVRKWAECSLQLGVDMDPYAPWWELEKAIVTAVERKLKETNNKQK